MKRGKRGATYATCSVLNRILAKLMRFKDRREVEKHKKGAGKVI